MVTDRWVLLKAYLIFKNSFLVLIRMLVFIGFFGLVKLPNPLLLTFSNEMYIFGWFIERHYLFVYLWSLYRSRVNKV